MFPLVSVLSVHSYHVYGPYCIRFFRFIFYVSVLAERSCVVRTCLEPAKIRRHLWILGLRLWMAVNCQAGVTSVLNCQVNSLALIFVLRQNNLDVVVQIVPEFLIPPASASPILPHAHLRPPLILTFKLI